MWRFYWRIFISSQGATYFFTQEEIVSKINIIDKELILIHEEFEVLKNEFEIKMETGSSIDPLKS